MTNVTGVVIDVVASSSQTSSAGYVYVSGAAVSHGDDSGTTSGNGFFTITVVDLTADTVIVSSPRFRTIEVGDTSCAVIRLWKNQGYT